MHEVIQSEITESFFGPFGTRDMLYAWILYTCFLLLKGIRIRTKRLTSFMSNIPAPKKHIQQWIERRNGALGCLSFQAITWPSSVTSLRGLNVFFSIAATQLMVNPLNGPRQKPDSSIATYWMGSVGIRSHSIFHWLIVGLGPGGLDCFGLETERDCYFRAPDSNPKPPGPKQLTIRWATGGVCVCVFNRLHLAILRVCAHFGMLSYLWPEVKDCDLNHQIYIIYIYRSQYLRLGVLGLLF